jgi:hypothetical protein
MEEIFSNSLKISNKFNLQIFFLVRSEIYGRKRGQEKFQEQRKV